jgi:hypothetical protein
MNELMANYFEAESAIVLRLQEEVTSLQVVMTPFSIGDMVESSQPSPAAHVIYGGDIVAGNEAGQGARRTIDQRWLVVLAVRTAQAQLQDTSAIRVIAGEIVPVLLKSLQGWQPVAWMRPLSRVSGPQPGYSSSFAYFPFMFEGRIIT